MKSISTVQGAGKSASAAIGLGVSSLLTVMAVLLLTSFALLSLLSANSDLLMSQKAAQAVKEYYAADCQAVTWMMHLTQTMAHTDEIPVDVKLYQAGFEAEYTNEAYIVNKTFSMGEKKNLIVSASVSTGGVIRILLWQSAPVYTPNIDPNTNS